MCLVVLASALPGLALAQEQCSAEQSRLDAINDRYGPIYEDYTQEGEQIPTPGLSGEVKWEETEMIFDTPTSTMRNRDLSMDVPTTTMRRKDIIFHTPSVRMKRLKVGQSPHVTCRGFKCTVRWRDNFTDVPEPFMEEQRIALDIPEFRMDRLRVVIGVPEFSMQRQRWVLKVPQFTANDPYSGAREATEAGEALKAKVEATRAEQMTETAGAVHGLYDCHRTEAQKAVEGAALQFDSAIAQLDASIELLRSRGADPTAVASADGGSTNLVAQRDALIAQRTEVMAQLSGVVDQLNRSEQQTMAQLET